jgi:hypothetical protein
MRHSSGVSLGKRALGPHRYRDELTADEGSKRRARRRVRRKEKQAWRREHKI